MVSTARVQFLCLIVAAMAASLPINPVFAATAAKKAAPAQQVAVPKSNATAPKGWEIVAIRRADGAFGFCRAETTDKANGLALDIALSPSLEVNLGIKVPKGNFTQGDAYPLTLSVDKLWSKQVQAEAALPELLLMRLGQDDAFMNAVVGGKMFSAKGDVDQTNFNLGDGAAVIKQLKACVADGVKETPASTNLPQGLSLLLKEAQLNVQPIPLAGGKSAQAVDQAWTVTVDGVEIDGGFREERVEANKTFRALVDATVAQLKSECGAGLKAEAGKEEALKDLTLQTYGLTCGKQFVGLVAYRTATNIYGLLMHRAPVEKKAAASTARDRLASVIRRISSGQ